MILTGTHSAPRLIACATQDQIDAWAKVVQRVHAKGGYFFAQLFHTGRCRHCRGQWQWLRTCLIVHPVVHLICFTVVKSTHSALLNVAAVTPVTLISYDPHNLQSLALAPPARRPRVSQLAQLQWPHHRAVAAAHAGPAVCRGRRQGALQHAAGAEQGHTYRLGSHAPVSNLCLRPKVYVSFLLSSNADEGGSPAGPWLVELLAASIVLGAHTACSIGRIRLPAPVRLSALCFRLVLAALLCPLSGDDQGGHRHGHQGLCQGFKAGSGGEDASCEGK